MISGTSAVSRSKQHYIASNHCHKLYAGDVGIARARLITRMAAEFADRSPEAIAQDLPEAVQLAELVLNCISLGKTVHPAEVSLDCVSLDR